MRWLPAALLLAGSIGAAALSAQEPTPTATPAAAAREATPAAARASSPVPSPTPSPTPSAAAKEDGGDAAAGGFEWGREVLGPLARFGGIALILFLVIWGLNLDKVLLPGAWSERTIIALAIILTFCALLLLDVHDEVLTVSKDVALIVVGFYFGTSKAGQEGKPVVQAAIAKGLVAPE